MPKGRSYSNDQWDSYDKGGQTFVQDDFVHDKTFVFKTKLEKIQTDGEKSNAIAGVNIKETFVQKTEGLVGNSEIKFWYNIWEKRSLFVKLGTNSNLQLQYDHGLGSLKEINTNLYATLDSNRSFTERIGSAGIELFANKSWSLNTRATYDFIKKSIQGDYKFSLLNGNWRFNNFSCIDITHRLLTKMGFLVGWKDNCKSNYFLRLEKSSRNDNLISNVFFDNAIVNWNNNISQTQTVGLEAKFNLRFPLNGAKKQYFNLESLWIASETKFDDSVFKAKVNLIKDLTGALMIKNKLSNYGTYSLGMEISEIGIKNKFKFGVQIDLNL